MQSSMQREDEYSIAPGMKDWKSFPLGLDNLHLGKAPWDSGNAHLNPLQRPPGRIAIPRHQPQTAALNRRDLLRR
jgi:hypothetical protein